MRDIKELLEILLDQYQNDKIYGIRRSGLCNAVYELKLIALISEQEEDAILKTLRQSRPNRSGDWYWPRGRVNPRIEFLKKLISEL